MSDWTPVGGLVGGIGLFLTREVRRLGVIALHMLREVTEGTKDDRLV